MVSATSSPLPVAVQATQNDAKSFYGIFIATFVVFLLIALVSQVLAVQWRPWFPGAEGEKSLIGAVKAGVYTFMSHLT
jgi:light-harvesting complex 1 beta chain